MNISDIYKIIYTEPRIFTKEELNAFKFDIKDRIIDCNISYRIYDNYVTIHPTIMEYYIIKYHQLHKMNYVMILLSIAKKEICLL